MSHKENETITVAWVDNGFVNGKFTDGLIKTIFESKKYGINIINNIREYGPLIAEQRQKVINTWINKLDTDWILWVDSDVVINSKSLKLIWDIADKDKFPVVSGLYFVSFEYETSMFKIVPAAFNKNNTNDLHKEIEKSLLGDGKIFKVDKVGFGFLIMHRSVIEKMYSVMDNKLSLFSAIAYKDNEKNMGEDLAFCSILEKAKIPLYLHSGALSEHLKVFPIDINYYKKFNK